MCDMYLPGTVFQDLRRCEDWYMRTHLRLMADLVACTCGICHAILWHMPVIKLTRLDAEFFMFVNRP